MTPTTVDAPPSTRLDAAAQRSTEIALWSEHATYKWRVLEGSWEGLSRLEELRAERSSRCHLGGFLTGERRDIREILAEFMRTINVAWTVQAQRESLTAPGSAEASDVEVELPAWKGPQPTRIQAVVRSVSRVAFRPITKDEMGGS
jgi:hypothetical protein